MKRVISIIILALIAMSMLTGCSNSDESNEVAVIDVNLDLKDPTFNDQITINIDTKNQVYDDCIIFLSKPSGIEIPFTRSSNCEKLIFTPKSLEVLFDEGEGQYGIKVVGKTDSIITGMGYKRFTLTI